MSGNTTAEVKMLPHVDANVGRRDFKSLKDHYEGVGVNAVSVLEAEETVRSLHYSGERNPTCGGMNSKRSLHTPSPSWTRKREELYTMMR